MRTFISYSFSLVFLFGFFPVSEVSAQLSDEELAARQVVIDLFDAMRARDGEAAAALFTEGAILESMGESENGPAKRVTPITGFVEAVGASQDEVWDERLWDITVHVSQRLATVWTKYAFYVGEEFSHCGVDSIVLFKSADGWKMTYIADTRKREGCDIPAEIQEGLAVLD